MSFADWISSITEDLPLVEKNADGQSRQIVFKHCSVEFNPNNKKSKRKNFLSRKMVAFSHWALEIGSYSYDLRVGNRQNCRYIISQIPYLGQDLMFEFHIRPVWHTHGRWTVGSNCKEGKQVNVGTTTLSDTDINSIAEKIVQAMNLRGGFHRIQNNCQVFSQEIARIVAPESTILNSITDAAKTMKKIDTLTKNVAYCVQDTLTEFRVKEMPKRLEHFFDDESYEETDAARIFLEAVEKIGAKAEVIDQNDKRWTEYKLQQPECLAPLFERVGIYTFSDAKTVAAWKQAMAYSNGGVTGQGSNFGTWTNSSNSLRPTTPTHVRAV